MGEGHAVMVVDLRLVGCCRQRLTEEALGLSVVPARVGSLARLVEVGPASAGACEQHGSEGEQTPRVHTKLLSALNLGSTRKSCRSRSIGSPT